MLAKLTAGLAGALLIGGKTLLLGAIAAVFVGCAVLAFFAGMLGLLALAVYLAGWRVRAWLSSPQPKD